MKTFVTICAVAAVCLLSDYAAAVNIELVTVGDPGNVGEGSGASYGGLGEDRICGAVDYVYEIGKYEVTVGQYTEFLNAVGGVDTYGLYVSAMADLPGNPSNGTSITQSGAGTLGDPYTYTIADSNYTNRPVNYVSFWSATRFANWMHNGQPTGAQGPGTTETGAYTLTSDGITNNTIVRNNDWKWAVASEDEWYKAAYYKGGGTNAGYWDHPTGTDEGDPPGSDVNDVSGNNGNIYPSGYPIQSPYYLTEVGEFQNSPSPYGTFDQLGNLWEWNEQLLDSNTTRGRRGSAFAHYEYNAHADTRNYPGDPAEAYYFVGFRLVNIPEPNSIILLGCGLSSLFCIAGRKR